MSTLFRSAHCTEPCSSQHSVFPRLRQPWVTVPRLTVTMGTSGEYAARAELIRAIEAAVRGKDTANQAFINAVVEGRRGGVPVRDIARACGLTPGAVYNLLRQHDT